MAGGGRGLRSVGATPRRWLLDSPHSGIAYPPEFDFVCDFPRLREAEDTHVDLLVGSGPPPRLGATLVRALFPRSFIDVNRSPEDLDAALIEGAWPGPVEPSEKTRLGMGLIRRLSKPGEPIYNRRLGVAEVGRSDRAVLASLSPAPGEGAGTTPASGSGRCGISTAIPCPRSPTRWPATPATPRADFVLGDRDGTTCDPAFRDLVAETLRGFGYRVAVNDPYKGVELVRRHGRPADGRHALQLEINRRLYMDERTLEPVPHFADLRGHLATVIERSAAFTRSR